MEVNLRPLEEKDAGRLFALVQKNRAHLGKFLDWVSQSNSIDFTLAFIRGEHNEGSLGRLLARAIYFNQELVGVISLTKIDHHRHSAEIGYWLDQDYQGKGIMTSAVKQIVHHGFEQLKLHRIEICCATANIRSQKIPERLGFIKEGVSKECICVDGKLLDAYVYACFNDLV